MATGRSGTTPSVVELDLDGLRGVVALPVDPAPWPGVIVLHEAAGLNADTRRICRHLATMGYAALAPALFAGGPRCIASAVRDALDPRRTGTTDRIERARTWLAEQATIATQRIGVIGFCMGGGFAVTAAARSPFAAAAVNYGHVPRDPTLFAGSCPVIGNYGADDLLVRADTPDRYRSALTDAGVEVDIEVFEGVGHSFMNHEPALLGPLRIRYDGPTAARAWERIDRFFADHLVDGTGGAG
jgi:carboxymethylenebutenolidase